MKNKTFLYKILVGALAGMCALIWIFCLWKWGDYLIGLPVSQRQEREMAKFYDYSVINERVSARPLQVADTRIFNGGEDKIDVVAEIINPNGRFLAHFNYYFVFGEKKTKSRQAFIFPGGSQLLAGLGIDGSEFTGSPDLVLEDIVWRRVSGKQVRDISAWQAERLNFTVSDFNFFRRGGADDLSAYAVRFKLTNDSPFSFAAPFFYVGLYEGQTMVGILPLELQYFRAQETRDIDVRSFASNLSVSDMQLFPFINVYDPDVYMKPGE